MNFWSIGIIITILAASGGTIVKLINDNAVSETISEANKQALVSYNNMVIKQIEDHNRKVADIELDKSALGELYTQTALKLEEEKEQIDSHDYEKIARRKPRMLEHVINTELDRLRVEVEDITGASKYRKDGNSSSDKDRKTETDYNASG